MQHLRSYSSTLSRPRESSHADPTLQAQSVGQPSPGHVHVKVETLTIQKQTKLNQETYPRQATEKFFS